MVLCSGLFLSLAVGDSSSLQQLDGWETYCQCYMRLSLHLVLGLRVGAHPEWLSTLNVCHGAS